MHKLLYVLCFDFYFEAKMNLKWFYIELECAVDEMSELLSSEKCVFHFNNKSDFSANQYDATN